MGFTIHSSVVIANAQALYRYLEKSNQLDLLPQILADIKRPEPNAQNRIPVELICENIRIIDHHVKDPCMGLKLIADIETPKSMVFRAPEYTIFGLTHGKHLHPMVILRMVERYFRILTEVTSVKIHITREQLVFEVVPNSPAVTHHQVDGVLVAIHRFFNRNVDSKLQQLKLKHSVSDESSKVYKSYFGIAPVGESDTWELIYQNPNAEVFDTTNYEMLIGRTETLLERNFPNQAFSESCKEVIKQLLPLGEPTREQVCKVFHMSVSTLKRKLKAENLTFKELLSEVRKSLADLYVREGGMNFTDTAFLLGYKDMPQFSKAFKKWYGVTPSNYFSGSGK